MSATPTGVVKFSQHHFGYGVFKLIHNSTREYLCLTHLPQLSENLSIFIRCPLGTSNKVGTICIYLDVYNRYIINSL